MTESWEDLTLPILEIVQGVRAASLRELVAFLNRSQGENEANPNSRIGRLVPSAVAALLHAELVVCERGKYQLSAQGAQLLVNPPVRLDQPYLETIPEYRAFWKKTRRDAQARAFQVRRFEYYAGGRELFFLGAWRPALTLLAYAIEYHLKAPLAAVEPSLTKAEERELQGRHNLTTLFKIAREHGFYKNCRIAPAFLEYAGDMFKLRYPRLEDNMLEQRRGYRTGGAVINTYDDCITQLDLALASELGDPTLTMGVVAAGFPSSAAPVTAAFFHCNPFALAHLQHFREVSESRPTRPLLGLPESPEMGFRAENLPSPSFGLERYNKLLSLELAAQFRLLRPGEPNPDPAAILLSGRSSEASSTKEILDYLRQAFGEHRVGVRRDSPTGDLHAFVFCRRATDWWRSLTLETNYLPQITLHNPGDKERLERWIHETRVAFESSGGLL